jgi:predicted short-subunit dehydrogenase-like oxidoreductase (DUF2520 family)
LISVIGLGKAGKCLINNFIKSGIDIESIWDRNEKKAKEFADKNHLRFEKPDNIKSDIIFIAVSDNAIENISAKLKSKEFHIHLSGYFPSSILSSKRKLSFHPNVPLNETTSLKDTIIDIEGEIKYGKYICSKIGSIPMVIDPEDKKKLHLTAVINSNFFLSLMYISKNIFPDNWEDISKILVFKTYENIIKKGFKEALTGPVARNDKEVINEERKIFKEYFPVEIYDNLINILEEVRDKKV